MNVTYDVYMAGYFMDMVGHEMGHNMGLRHNFRGNLGAQDANGTQPPSQGKVTTSIMEYLGRPFRYLDEIGPYDAMAIAYGYTGKKPPVLNGFCTDEDVGNATKADGSAECSRDDATSDPFSYFEGKVSRALDKLTERNTAVAPTWAVDDMGSELGAAFSGLGLYASSAAKASSTWTQFFGKAGRPADAAATPAYVAARIKAQLCDPKLDAGAANKPTAEAQAKVRTNLAALRAKAAKALPAFGVTFSCE